MEAPRPTTAQVATATISRLGRHFSRRSWSSGIAILRCKAADRAGVVDEFGNITVDGKQIAANRSRPRRTSSPEIKKAYARVEAKLDGADVAVYIVPLAGHTVRRLSIVIGESIVWGYAGGAYVIEVAGDVDEIGEALSAEEIPKLLMEWLWPSLEESVALAWSCAGPGDYRAWRRLLSELRSQ